MAVSVPPTKPRLSSGQLQNLISTYKIDREKYPLVVVGIRGYYLNSLGKPGENDRGIYDDALFIDSPFVTASFNANTDPTVYRKGTGLHDHTKGIARLKPGLWMAHAFGLHKNKYLALIQSKGKVTVIRDGHPDYEDTGNFGLNIHKGGYHTTSSLGCQTIHPAQWESFINLAKDQAVRLFRNKWNKTCIPYILIENSGQY